MDATRPGFTFAFDLLGGRVKCTVRTLGARRRGVVGMWSTPGGAVSVPFKGVFTLGVNVNMSKLLPDVPSNVVAALTALFAPTPKAG